LVGQIECIDRDSSFKGTNEEGKPFFIFTCSDTLNNENDDSHRELEEILATGNDNERKTALLRKSLEDVRRRAEDQQQIR
jgi:hypothetical protein